MDEMSAQFVVGMKFSGKGFAVFRIRHFLWSGYVFNGVDAVLQLAFVKLLVPDM